jgi:hypothetical protein
MLPQKNSTTGERRQQGRQADASSWKRRFIVSRTSKRAEERDRIQSQKMQRPYFVYCRSNRSDREIWSGQFKNGAEDCDEKEYAGWKQWRRTGLGSLTVCVWTNLKLGHDGVFCSRRPAGVLRLEARGCLRGCVKRGGPRQDAHMGRRPMLGMSVSLRAIASLVMLPCLRRVTKTSQEMGLGMASMKPRLASEIAACTSGWSTMDIFVL